MMRLELILLVSGISLFAVGCSSSEADSLSAYGNEHRIELYSGGTRVREWNSTGKVLSEQNGNGVYFKDLDSGQVIHVMGNVIVTPLGKGEAQANKGKRETNPDWEGLPPNVDAGNAINGVPDPFETLDSEKAL